MVHNPLYAIIRVVTLVIGGGAIRHDGAVGQIAPEIILICGPPTHRCELVTAIVGVAEPVTGFGVLSAAAVAISVVCVGDCFGVASRLNRFSFGVEQIIVVVGSVNIGVHIVGASQMRGGIVTEGNARRETAIIPREPSHPVKRVVAKSLRVSV